MEGQEATFAIIALAAIVVLLLAWLLMQRRRTKALRKEFGDEYDRTVEARGGRRHAEADLVDRKERVKKLEIRPLTPSERDRYKGDWQETKALFVDSPVEAVSRADRLLTDIMNTRGFPMSDFEHRHGDLTVDHAKAAKHYLAGHEIARRSSDATTEELRRAINHYEALFSEMTSKLAEQDGDIDHDGSYVADGNEERDVDLRDNAPTKPAAFSTTTSRPS
jgi:hypothetical protein